MTALIHGELIKLRTTRTALGFATAAVLLVLATVLVVGLAADPHTVDEKRDAINFGGSLSVVFLIFGVVGATGEYRHRTIAQALLIAPDRVRVVLARLAAYAVCAALVALLMLVVDFGIGIPLVAGASGPGLDSGDYLHAGAGGILVTVLTAAIGAGIGVIVPNQVAAVVGTLIWFFILEPLMLLIPGDAGRYTIGEASAALGGGSGGDERLSFGVALATLAGWAVVLVLVGVLVDRRRDVD